MTDAFHHLAAYEHFEDLLRLFLSLILGGIVGWQREHYGHEAGIRTFCLISLGSCLFGLLSHHTAPGGDPTRIAAQVVSGIGFIGIGLIIKERGEVKGLTTAATLWAASAVGLSLSFGLYVVSIFTTILIFAALYLRSLPKWDRLVGRPVKKERPFDDDPHFP